MVIRYDNIQNKTKFLFWAVVVVVFSCNDNSHKPIHASKTDTLKNPTSFHGTFAGVTPCADCPGIYTVVQFSSDSTFREYSDYLERNSRFADSGKWVRTDSLITVNMSNGNKRYFGIRSDSSISMLDSEGKPVTGEMSKNYFLNRKDTLLQP